MFLSVCWLFAGPPSGDEMAMSAIVEPDREGRRGKFPLARLDEMRQHSFWEAHASSRAVVGALADRFLNPRQNVCAGAHKPAREAHALPRSELPGGIAVQLVSSNSSSSCFFKCRRADFLMARRSAATASFSARRCFRVRVSTCLGKCEIFGRRAPTFRSFGFANGFILLRITLAHDVPYCSRHR